MNGCVNELLVTLGSPCLSILSVDVQWTLTKRVRAFDTSFLLHTVVSYSIVLANNSPVTTRDFLNKAGDSSGLCLRQEDCKLEVRSTFCTLLELPDSISTPKLVMYMLKEVRDSDVLVMLLWVVHCADEPHSFSCLLFRLVAGWLKRRHFNFDWIRFLHFTDQI